MSYHYAGSWGMRQSGAVMLVVREFLNHYPNEVSADFTPIELHGYFTDKRIFNMCAVLGKYDNGDLHVSDPRYRKKRWFLIPTRDFHALYMTYQDDPRMRYNFPPDAKRMPLSYVGHFTKAATLLPRPGF